MAVDAVSYRQGQPAGCPDWLGELASRREAGEGFVWLALVDPDAAELAQVARELHLHPVAVEDATAGHQRPKLVQYRDSLFLVLTTLRYLDASSDVETGEVSLFVGEGFAVTVQRGQLALLDEVRRRLAEQAAQPGRMQHGPAVVLHAVMDSVVDGCTEVDAELQQDLDELEIEVFSDASRADARTIYALKREVLEFRRAVTALEEPAARLWQDEVRFVPQAARPFFRDVADHVLRASQHADSYDSLLTDALNAHLAQVSVRQNEDMRKISAWVAIAALPTVLAGIYGMNFQHMPELGWRWGYPAVLAVMAVGCAVLHRLFRRSGWL